MDTAWGRLERGETADLNATSQAIITTFNKILDPTSVVRESEYDRTPSGQALIDRIEGKLNTVVEGGPGLTKESLKELVDLGRAFAKGAQESIDAKNASAREEAQFFGLNPDFVIPGSQSGGDIRQQVDSAGYDYDAMKADGLTDDQIRQELGFSQVGNTTASIDIPTSSRLAYVNNNPANLKFAGQQGAVKGEKGFAKFSSPEAGVQALERQIQLDTSRGLTLEQFINKFAPPSENDTNTYIAQVMQMTGANKNTKLSQIDINALKRAIVLKESSTQLA
jgi:hypothetical protein